MSARKKPENQIKALQKLIQEAREILICQGFMEIKMPDTMQAAITKFLDASK